MIEQIKAKIDAIKTQKEQLVADLRKDFFPILKPLFDKSAGRIQSIGWTQYTPYFNDGEECTFGVGTDYLYVNGTYEEDQSFTDWGIRKYMEGEKAYGEWVKEYPDDAINPEERKEDIETFQGLKSFKDALHVIPDEFFKDLFGDHVQVTVHSDGRIETEEYEHD